MASGPAVLASSGASFANLANIASSLLKFPPAFQPYLDYTLSHLSPVVTGTADYVYTNTGLSPTAFYSTLAAVVFLGALTAVVDRAYPRRRAQRVQGRKMRRYGWSSSVEREQLSPFNSTIGRDGEIPSVTDRDYEYITSEDLQNQGVDSQHAYEYNPRESNPHFARSPASPTLEIPDDDIILIRHNRTSYPEHFPAYSIGDGKLLVGDVRDRVQIVDETVRQPNEAVEAPLQGEAAEG